VGHAAVLRSNWVPAAVRRHPPPHWTWPRPERLENILTSEFRCSACTYRQCIVQPRARPAEWNISIKNMCQFENKTPVSEAVLGSLIPQDQVPRGPGCIFRLLDSRDPSPRIASSMSWTDPPADRAVCGTTDRTLSRLLWICGAE
jgi:hypothetical protein